MDPGRRAALEKTIAETAAPEPAAVLTGWVLIGEWMAPDGTKHLTRLSSAPATTWYVAGLLHEALYGGDWDS